MENQKKITTSVSIGNKTLPYPVLVSAGTVGYGEIVMDCDTLGAIVCKTLTIEPREGNPPPVTHMLEHGYLNSIGLKNIGIQQFAKEYIPKLSRFPFPYIVSITGENFEQFSEIITYLQSQDSLNTIWGWELNMSCPNVKGGTDIGKEPHIIREIVSSIRLLTDNPILVKLPPNVDDISILGLAAEEAGADAISAVNTFKGMWIDTKTRTPIFHRKTGGYSGPAIFPAALALVYELCQKVTIPVIAIGGITSPDHAIQYLLAGAKAVQIGTANFTQKNLASECISEIIEYCRVHNISSTGELKLN